MITKSQSLPFLPPKRSMRMIPVQQVPRPSPRYVTPSFQRTPSLDVLQQVQDRISRLSRAQYMLVPIQKAMRGSSGSDWSKDQAQMADCIQQFIPYGATRDSLLYYIPLSW